MDIYTKTILQFASNIPYAERLKNPDVSITKRTAVCGSSMTVDLNIKNGKIEKIGLDVKACALGQASASIFSKNAVGLNLRAVQKLKTELIGFLKTGKFQIKEPLGTISIWIQQDQYRIDMTQYYLFLIQQKKA